MTRQMMGFAWYTRSIIPLDGWRVPVPVIDGETDSGLRVSA